MKKLLLILFTMFTLLLPVSSVSAFSALGAACSAGNTGSSVCKAGSNNPISGTDGIINKVTNLIVIFAGVVAVFLIALAGFKYVTSNGDPARVDSAKNTILFVVVGLIVIALAKIILSYVIHIVHKGLTAK